MTHRCNLAGEFKHKLSSRVKKLLFRHPEPLVNVQPDRAGRSADDSAHFGNLERGNTLTILCILCQKKKKNSMVAFVVRQMSMIHANCLMCSLES